MKVNLPLVNPCSHIGRSGCRTPRIPLPLFLFFYLMKLYEQPMPLASSETRERVDKSSVCSSWLFNDALPTACCYSCNGLDQGCTNPRRQVVVVSKFPKMAPSVCVSSVLDLVHVSLLGPRILGWPLNFEKCGRLCYIFVFIRRQVLIFCGLCTGCPSPSKEMYRYNLIKKRMNEQTS